MALSCQNKYFLIKQERNGKQKDKIIKLGTGGITNNKLVHEIKIFNSLFLVMPCVGGVACLYSKLLCCLIKNPKHKPENNAYEKLLYGYACYVLLTKTNDEIVSRQLRKNLLFLFAPKLAIKKNMKISWCSEKYNLHPKPIYKIFNNSFLDLSVTEFITESPTRSLVLDSYIKYENKDITIRRFDDFFEMRSKVPQKVIFVVAEDKASFDCSISRGVVTCTNIDSGWVKTYTVRGNDIRISNSMCEKTDKLEIYIYFSGLVTVSINNAVRKLLYSNEIQFNKNVERIVEDAYKCKFISGEKLRQRYKKAEACVPSLRLLTKVVEIKDAQSFLDVLDELEYYKKIASLFSGFNIVFLYSSGSKFVADLVGGFISKSEVNSLTKANVFLFFIDRAVTDPDAIYFLARMMRGNKYTELAPNSEKQTVSKSYPYKKVILLSNKTAAPTIVTEVVPLKFTSPSVVTVSGLTLTAVGLYTGKVSVYKLPCNVNIDKELLTMGINICIKTKLMGFEQKRFYIQKQDTVLQSKEKKKNFLMSLEKVIVKTNNKDLSKIFSLPVIDENNTGLLEMVKTAYRNIDKQSLISLLVDRNALPISVWEYLMSKIIGIRFSGGKVHLVPCINIVGDFILTFEFEGKPYAFNAKKQLEKTTDLDTILHG